MKRYLILPILILIFSSHKGYTQIKFERGYFIDNNDEKVDCFINNLDWYFNPTEFVYKISNEANPTRMELSGVKEFKVGNHKYVRESVKIDKSKDDIRKLDRDRNPKWSDETLFLRVIVEGNATLYSYRNEDVLRFFFSIGGNPVEQLIHKLFLIETTEAKSNNDFWNQLMNTINCKNLSSDKIKEVKYSQRSLAKYFDEHNLCVGGDNISIISTKDKDSSESFRIRLTTGLDKSQLRLESSNSTTNLSQEFSPRAGLELEVLLPFNKNKWSVILEPTYQAYSSDSKFKTRYSSIEVPFGVRHGFYLGANSKIFVNLSVVVDVPLKYEVELSNTRMLIGKRPGISGAAGFGYSYKRLSIEARYYMDRAVLDESDEIFFIYDKLSVIIGFRLY